MKLLKGLSLQTHRDLSVCVMKLRATSFKLLILHVCSGSDAYLLCSPGRPPFFKILPLQQFYNYSTSSAE